MSARRHRRSPAAARVFTIPPGLSFLDALAAGLIARAGQDPLALSAMTVLLPTRRACRSLEAAFLRQSEGRALLLPAIRPLGDIDEDALAEEAGLEAADAAALDLAPAIPRLRRRLLLAREVLDWSLKHKGDAPTRGTLTPDQAARLADELAHLLDQVETERLSFAALDGLVPADYAAHWQQTLRFLKLITRHWPKLLKSLDLIDPALHRDRGLSALARSYRQNPPAHPVIAAGSTGSIPATAELLGAIAHLPEGAVVLPGLDRTLDEESWQALEPTHPQYGLKFLLERLGVAHEAVPDWPTPLEPTTPASRAWLIAAALRPAAAPARRLERAALNAALCDVVRIDCANPREEAGVIAFILRETLESEGKRAALVTLDRMLARRVAAALKRFAVVVDDSAGLPLAKTPPGTFLRLIAEAAAERWPPVKFLAVLKHPLAACGLSRLRLLETVRRVELAVLRGPRPAPGLAGLREALSKQARDPALGALVGGLERLAALFDGLIAAGRASAHELVRQHLALAEALAVEEKEAGRLWAGEAGEAAAAFTVELAEHAGSLGDIAGAAYPALFEQLISGAVVRPQRSAHPRLFIWGPLEARLQHVERVVIAGLNEGSFPPEPEADPWLSRPMRETFGLPSLERRIGLSAHDFVQLFNAPEVFLTRARKVEGTPSVPSRWLVRLKALLDAEEDAPRLDRQAPRWLAWQRALDRPQSFAPASPPSPAPPLSLRPRRLSVTEIETWMRDPYAIYARRVLKLEPLDPLDADFGAAERGEFIHRALDRFMSAYRDRLPEDALERLLALGREAFGPAFGRNAVWAFWWPRFWQIAQWFIDTEHARREEGLCTLASETRGELALTGPAGPFTLRAKADRIDRLVSGELAVIDYKTGAIPEKAQVRLGFAPQLPLEALIAEQGGFAEVPAAPVGELAYWQLKGGDKPGKIERVASRRDSPPRELIDQAREGLARLIAAFDDPATPYPARPDAAAPAREGPYDHLARVKEWQAQDEGGEA